VETDIKEGKKRESKMEVEGKREGEGEQKKGNVINVDANEQFVSLLDWADY
jgi:hypothetical protein